MNRSSAFRITALLAFLLTYGNAALLSEQVPNSEGAGTATDQHRLSPANEQFSLSMIGEARASDGTPLGVRRYTGSKGTTVSIMYGTFESAEKSKAELQRWIAGATKLVQREQNKTSSGHVVGERALIMFTDSRTQRDYPVIVWTSGSDFFRIKSFSLAAVLQFEERIKKGASLIEPPLAK